MCPRPLKGCAGYFGDYLQSPADGKQKKLTKKERQLLIDRLRREMQEAARLLEFEHAAFLRDEIQKLEQEGERKLK